jgi:hypothetical protein
MPSTPPGCREYGPAVPGRLMKPLDIAVHMIAFAGHAKAVRFLREAEDYADITSSRAGAARGARGQACGIDGGSPVTGFRSWRYQPAQLLRAVQQVKAACQLGQCV